MKKLTNKQIKELKELCIKETKNKKEERRIKIERIRKYLQKEFLQQTP